MATRPERRPRGQDRRGAARCRPVFPLRDWHEGGKSTQSVPVYTLPYLPTPVSPFHAEPSHLDTGRVRKKGWQQTVDRHLPGPRGEFSCKVLHDHTAGDPMRADVKWTNLSRREIARRVTAMGTPASRNIGDRPKRGRKRHFQVDTWQDSTSPLLILWGMDLKGAVAEPTHTQEDPSPCAPYPLSRWIANAAARFTGPHGAVTEQAQQTGCSRQCVYDHAQQGPGRRRGRARRRTDSRAN